ncbi:unnamed protein product [Closterium sp. NIES-53]
MTTFRHGFLLAVLLLLVVSVLPPTINATRLISAPFATCGKYYFPEVVGMTGTKAREHILAVSPQCHWDVKIIPANGYTTFECRRNRIRVFVDKRGLVQMVPVTCVPPPQK